MPHSESLSLRSIQEILRGIFLNKDSARGIDGTFMYFVSEVGELAEALRTGEDIEKEFADSLAWLISVANLAGIDFEEVMRKYYLICPDCKSNPCKCNSKP